MIDWPISRTNASRWKQPLLLPACMKKWTMHSYFSVENSGRNRDISISIIKDKLEDMDVSLIFCHRPKWAMIFIRSLWPNRWVNLKSQGAKWKIWTLSFHRYLLVCCRSSGLVTAHCQSWVVFDVFQKITFFYPAPKTNFWKLFFKMLSFEDDLIKMDETNCKWPQISQIFISWKSS